MNSECWVYSLILVINAYDTARGQVLFDTDDTQDFTKCGDSTLVSTISPLIIDGTVSQIGNFPWHAGLYYRQQKNGKETWDQKCGGSLITDQFVLTAAHCVYNIKEENLRVTLGKIQRSWDRYEYGQQKRNVSNIIYPYDFQEVTYYFDIALLLLDEKVKFGKRVMPVCNGFRGGSDYLLNKKLFVAGWGQTKNVQSGSPSETLLYTDVSFLPKNTCQQFVPVGFVMFDKFCTTKSNNTGSSVVQRGDSGGGLTVVHNGQHYIYGIISIKLTTSYDSQMTLFTNLSWPNHILWLESEVGRYHNGFKWSEREPTKDTTDSRGCELPKSSQNRKFCSLDNGCAENCSFDNERCLVPPGSNVGSVKVVCAPGYSTTASSNDEIVHCLKNKWHHPLPTCHKLCPSLKSEMLLMTCRFGVNIEDCSKPALPDTTVTFECAPTFSEYSNLRREGEYNKVLTCKSSGEWSDKLPICKPMCGVFNKNIKLLTPTIVGGEEAHLGFLPWHAGLYYRKGNSWEQRCGGSLITSQFVLTAAHCVEDEKADDLRVAVGKYYRSWDRVERSEQKRYVKAISFSTQYKSPTMLYNIALVQLNESVRLGEYVMPVCRDMTPGVDDYQNNNLYVAGWGRTEENGNRSEVLLYNTLSTITKGDCQAEVPPFFTFLEKICAVNVNNSEAVTQQGDSGGGLTAIYKDGLHYIVGISTSKYKHVSVFTYINWSPYIDWVENEMNRLG